MSNPALIVVRLGHRHDRDARITTHIGLVARAWGATRLLISGDRDSGVLDTVRDVNGRFGGTMDCSHESSSTRWLKRFVAGSLEDVGQPGLAIHLTMYGLPVDDVIPSLPRDQPTAFVVGGPKVPPEIWDICQHHVSIGSQPHSEVAALAIALDRWGARPDDVDTSDARLRIVPAAQGKQVLDSTDV
ncbi:MAG TPA: hypothetical protein QF646_02010 [Candidatus Poseidoniales archaeon]|nr:hypothetical protein [Candidatus Poseidoniales archaeon]